MAYKRIPIAYSVPSAQSNMPLYVKPSVMTGWGSLTLAEAQSGRWYADEDMVTQIAREVASADEIHVKFPTVPTTGGEGFHDYDGVRADLAVTDTYGRNAVWGGYAGVWHLNGNAADSSGNGHNGTPASGVSFTTSGKFSGNVATFNNTNNAYINIPSSADFNPTTLRITFWVNATSTGVRDGLIGRANASGSQRGAFIINRAERDSVFMNAKPVSGSAGFVETVGNPVNVSDGWVKITSNIVGAGATGSSNVYKNLIKASGTISTFDFNTNPIRIGKQTDTFWTNLGAAMCGVRWSTSDPKTDDWETTEYNNQNDVASFWGTVTDAGGAPVTNKGFMAWL